MADSDTFDAHRKQAPATHRRLCLKVANQAGKGQWWNAMAVATELVAACQKGCRAEIAKVAQKKRIKRK